MSARVRGRRAAIPAARFAGGESQRGGREPSREPHTGRDGDDWHVVSRRRRKALGQDGSGWENRQGNWQSDDRFGYALRPARFRVAAVRHHDDWARTNGDMEVYHDQRLSRARLARRRTVPVAASNMDSDATGDGQELRSDQHPGSEHEGYSPYKRFVTFYFINFPPQLSTFYIRKGFEVCGLLEDVVIPRRRNASGEFFGFVRFSKVRDVGKLLKAVNAVTFGNYRIQAKVARFDRSANVYGEGRRHYEGVNGAGKRSVVNPIVVVKGAATGVTTGRLLETDVPDREGKTLGVAGSGGGAGGAGGSKEMAEVKGAKEGVRTVVDVNQWPAKKLVCAYHSNVDDLKWAQSGVLATVVKGEAITLVQSRVEDAGFGDLAIIPLGADRVFLRSTSEKETMGVIEEAKEFFDLLFANYVRWNKEAIPFRRGAWLRLYGIPIHAWSETFFKLCVMDCGTFLRTDDCSSERGRFDYARVLVSTPSLDIVSSGLRVMVDGALVVIKIIEEWGFNIGEDACLFESDEDCQSQADTLGECGDVEAGRVVDSIVESLAKDVEAGGFHSDEDERPLVRVSDSVTPVVDSGSGSNVQTVVGADKGISQGPAVVVASSARQADVTEKQVFEGEGFGVEATVEALEGVKGAAVSDPLFTSKAVVPGPWSSEWLKDHHGDAGIIFAARKKIFKAGKRKVVKSQGSGEGVKRRKCGGDLRHPIHTLKKVARLSFKERRAVLKVLKTRAQRRKKSVNTHSVSGVPIQASSDEGSSSDSVNKDWNNWVVLHGKEKEAVEDVWGLGKAIGLHYGGDIHNMFGALSKSESGMRKSSNSAGGVSGRGAGAGC